MVGICTLLTSQNNYLDKTFISVSSTIDSVHVIEEGESNTTVIFAIMVTREYLCTCPDDKDNNNKIFIQTGFFGADESGNYSIPIHPKKYRIYAPGWMDNWKEPSPAPFDNSGSQNLGITPPVFKKT